ncbi:MAG: cupredoxin domain-containing protein [Bacteroidota bacterium]|nr:cupredoxin domain-containing protein [Bacteroidota bacterium]
MPTRRIGITLIVLLIGVVLAFPTCKKDTVQPTYNTTLDTTTHSTTSTTNQIAISGMAFSPSSTTVNVGTTVTWTNNDNITHTVTSNSSTFDSGDLTYGKTFSFTFTTAGTYMYYCKYHSSMTGSVIVK